MRTTTIATLILLASLLCLTAKADTMGLMNITTDTVLTENHIGGIVIGADNISLDCAGHTITEIAPFGAGVLITGPKKGNTIKNCHVEGFTSCFSLSGGASDNMLTNNSATDCVRGFALTLADNNILRNNTTIGNNVGIILSRSSKNFLMRNDVDQSGDFGIRVVAAHSNKLIDNTVVRGKHTGIQIRVSNKNNFKLNTACGNGTVSGVDVNLFDDGSSGNNLRNNDFCTTFGF